VVALPRFESGEQGVFAATVLPGRSYPDLINDDMRPMENSFVLRDAALADVLAWPCGPTGPTRGAVGSAGNGCAPRASS
jgi:hypothetical protein